MIVTKLILKNWRNFSSVDVALGDRVLLVGPNAAGKSNFLEVFRFLRDIAKGEGGGLQNAIAELCPSCPPVGPSPGPVCGVENCG